MYEGQLNQLAQQTFNMESASLTTDNLRNTMATVDAMNIANKEMRKQYGKIDIDKIEVIYFIMRLFLWRFVHLEADATAPRIYIMIWKIYWNRRMKFKSR